MTLKLGSPCLLPKAWLLLSFALTHVHITKVIRQLVSHKFVTVLQRSLALLHTLSAGASIAPANDVTHENARNANEESGSDTDSQNASLLAIDDIAQVYISLCRCVRQIQDLAETESRHGNAATAEHLKYATHCSMQEAATILGNACYIGDRVLQHSHMFSDGGRKGESKILMDSFVPSEYLQSVVQIWEQSTAHEDSAVQQVQNVGLTT